MCTAVGSCKWIRLIAYCRIATCSCAEVESHHGIFHVRSMRVTTGYNSTMKWLAYERSFVSWWKTQNHSPASHGLLKRRPHSRFRAAATCDMQ
jgi:hypothetical protein